jgi:Cysteine-rich secretory protein family
MKRITILFIFLMAVLNSFCQAWTETQLDSADTGKDINDITEVEKDVIRYINLARLYPQDFLKNEVENYTGNERYGDYVKNSPYKRSLIKELRNRKPVNVLRFDKSLYEYAKCFAKESGDAGAVTHKRKKCAGGYFAECCSYGMDTGKDVALQWLIDDKTPNLGHRINCLNKEYSLVGISMHSHKVYRYCVVADMQ